MDNEIVLAGKLIEIIETSRNNALRKVNEELIRMYWSVGGYLSAESKNAAFGILQKKLQELVNMPLIEE